MKAVQHISNMICIQHTVKTKNPSLMCHFPASSIHFIITSDVLFPRVSFSHESFRILGPDSHYSRNNHLREKVRKVSTINLWNVTSANHGWWLSGGRDGEGCKPVNCLSIDSTVSYHSSSVQWVSKSLKPLF